MEYSIVHSDLENQEIKPQELSRQYVNLLEQDIRQELNPEEFVPFSCPSCGEGDVRGEYMKLGMRYCLSKTYANIYISPRPTTEQLLRFYQKSRARRFWLTELWEATSQARQQKIIEPQMEWISTCVEQYLGDNRPLQLAEVFPMQWAYYERISREGARYQYTGVYPMFPLDSCPHAAYKERAVHWGTPVQKKFDVICLFEALDRAYDPRETWQWVFEHLNPGGLVFITALLASGFEVQVLGPASPVLTPPERMNIFSYEGLIALIKSRPFAQILEFSTPGVLDVPNIRMAHDEQGVAMPAFMEYLIDVRRDENLFAALQEFLQMNKLSAFSRIVAQKEK